MADDEQPRSPGGIGGGQWGPAPSGPPPAGSPPDPPPGDDAPGGGPSAAPDRPEPAWGPVSGRGSARSLSGPTLAALGMLVAGAFYVLAALIDMVQADDAFGEFGAELGFLDRVAIGMGRLDARLALLLPLALLLVRSGGEQPPPGPAEARATRAVVAGTAFLSGAFMFLIALHLVAALAGDGFTITSKGAALFENLGALAVAAGAGVWAWRLLQRLGDGPVGGRSAGSWPPAPDTRPPPGTEATPGGPTPESRSVTDQPGRSAEQERRWGPPPV